MYFLDAIKVITCPTAIHLKNPSLPPINRQGFLFFLTLKTRLPTLKSNTSFNDRPDRPWGPPCLLYNGYRVPFPGVKRPRRGINHTPISSAEVKERVALYMYSPSEPSCPVPGRTLPLLFHFMLSSPQIHFRIGHSFNLQQERFFLHTP